MNKRQLCFLLACCMATLSFSATLRVSNVSGVQAPYTTIAAALTAASAGDIILVDGSATSYGNVTVSKQVTIMGAGIATSTTQAYQYSAQVDGLTISASGVTITGMTISLLNISGTNALIKRNRIHTSTNNTLITVSSTGAIFEQNYITAQVPYSAQVVYPIVFQISANTNTTIRNNSIYAYNSNTSGYSYQAIAIASASTTTSIVILQNNVIFGNITTYFSTVFNNIFMFGNVSGTDNTYSNNISNSNQIPTTNGNLQGIIMTNVFVPSGSYGDEYKLKSGSPAIGKGVGGGDCGMFSADTGGNPYISPNMPQAPSIYQMTINPSTATSTIQLTIKAASH